jgi:NitT/TauT family transport system permease protein
MATADSTTRAAAPAPTAQERAPAMSAPPQPSPLVAKLRRERRMRWWRLQGARVLLLIVLICGWQFLVGKPGAHPWTLVDEYYVSKPSAIWDAVHGWLNQGVLFSNIWVTTKEMILGFAIGATLGLAIGFFIGTSKFVGEVLTPFISALYSVPRLALVPLFLIWFGLGIASKLAFVAMLVFFLVFYNTYAGVRDVDKDLLDTLRVMGARRRHLYLKVTLPSAMTWILAGLRTSAPYALVGAVTAEMISSNEGMGYLLTRSSGQFFTAGVFGAIVVMMVMAIAVNGLVVLAEHRLLSWKRRGVTGDER